MPRKENILIRILFSTIVCVLICGVFASEIPEQIALRDNTSNDFVLRSPSILKSIQTLTSARQDVGLSLNDATPHPSVQFRAFVFDAFPPMMRSLFILHSSLRR
jgi:hypothetical protein